MARIRGVLVLICAAVTLPFVTSVLAQSEVTKKVISFSGTPNARRFHDDVQEMERRMPVVDGVTIYAATDKGGVATEALGRLFRVDFHRLEDFDTGIDHMRRARPNLYRHNFLLVYMASGVHGLEVPDWLDPGFDAVINNWKVAAEYCKAAGMRGFLFDDERYYGRDLWSYEDLKYKDTTTAEEYYDIVFERGAQIMRAVNTVYPDIHILSVHGPTQPLLLTGGRQADRHYEMIRAFFDGLLSECTGDAAIIDGSGRSYEYKRLWQFERAAGRFRDMRQYSRVPDKWDRHAQIGFPIFIGSHGFSTDDFSANYYSPEELTTALGAALEHADEYVWIYSHHTSLWDVRSDTVILPDAYRDAMLAAHDPRQYVTAVAEGPAPTLPRDNELQQSFPNPFNSSTAIRFTIGKRASAELSVYNAAGQQVATLVMGELPAGRHAVRWDGRDAGGRALGSGLYLYRLRVDGWEATRKLLLLQ